jgi:hypothetical protein
MKTALQDHHYIKILQLMILTHPLRYSRLRFSPVSFLLTGFLPVSSIVLHCLGILPLQYSLLFLILPMLTLAAGNGAVDRSTGRIAFRGWLSGIVAVFLYDVTRMPFIMAGWEDFIPRIGGWLMQHNNPVALTGYAWRYIGNGGGLGMAFFMIVHVTGMRDRFIQAGLVFGAFVFGCLILILAMFREAQEMMFHITPLSLAGSFTGHMIYGVTLGWLAKKYWNGAGCKVQGARALSVTRHN